MNWDNLFFSYSFIPIRISKNFWKDLHSWALVCHLCAVFSSHKQLFYGLQGDKILHFLQPPALWSKNFCQAWEEQEMSVYLAEESPGKKKI